MSNIACLDSYWPYWQKGWLKLTSPSHQIDVWGGSDIYIGFKSV